LVDLERVESRLLAEHHHGFDVTSFSFPRSAWERVQNRRWCSARSLGESEALALAIELRADVILIDELAGRAAARREGLEVIGVLGVLREAKLRGLIETISPLLDQLQNKYRFFIGEQLRREILRSVGE
jgi:predicted nucleic acid-binding protein